MIADRPSLIVLYGNDAPALAATFPGLPEDDYASAGEFAWAWYDPEAPGRADPFAGPANALGPVAKAGELALAARPAGPDRWLLAIVGNRKPPHFQAIHLDLIRTLADPAATRKLKAVADAFAAREADLPARCRTPADSLFRDGDTARPRGLSAALSAQAKLAIEALRGASIPFLNDDVRLALTGRGVDPAVLAGPLGTIPHLLAALGLGAVLDDAGIPVPPELAEYHRPADDLRALVAPPLPIVGGPVPIGGADPGRLWRIPWFCDTDVEIDWYLVPPPGSTIALAIVAEDHLVRRRGRSVHVDLAWTPPGWRPRIYSDLGPIILGAPDGTAVELVAAATPGGPGLEARPPLRSGNQRYAGRVVNGKLLLDAATPEVTADDLRAALAIARSIEGSGPIPAADADEARAAVAAGLRTAWFPPDQKPPEAVGAAVTCRGEDRPFVAMFLFRRRFAAGPWDTASAQLAEEADQGEWSDTVEQVSEALQSAIAVPPTGEVLLRTDLATYRRADIVAMRPGLLDVLDALETAVTGGGAPPDHLPSLAEKVAPIVDQLVALGFRPLGDVHCDRIETMVLRAFAGADGLSFAYLAADLLGHVALDLIAAFDDGATLTTSTAGGLKDRKRAKVFAQSFPDRSPAALDAHHRARLAALAADGRRPLPIDPTLEGFCRAFDVLLAHGYS